MMINDFDYVALLLSVLMGAVGSFASYMTLKNTKIDRSILIDNMVLALICAPITHLAIISTWPELAYQTSTFTAPFFSGFASPWLFRGYSRILVMFEKKPLETTDAVVGRISKIKNVITDKEAK